MQLSKFFVAEWLQPFLWVATLIYQHILIIYVNVFLKLFLKIFNFFKRFFQFFKFSATTPPRVHKIACFSALFGHFLTKNFKKFFKTFSKKFYISPKFANFFSKTQTLFYSRHKNLNETNDNSSQSLSHFVSLCRIISTVSSCPFLYVLYIEYIITYKYKRARAQPNT